MDAGAARLGEVALVPHNSPVAQTGLLFYNTLFDENAASHVALGAAYKFTLRGGETMTDEEFEPAGGNRSATHVDFMIGSAELDIDGGCPRRDIRAGDAPKASGYNARHDCTRSDPVRLVGHMRPRVLLTPFCVDRLFCITGQGRRPAAEPDDRSARAEEADVRRLLAGQSAGAARGRDRRRPSAAAEDAGASWRKEALAYKQRRLPLRRQHGRRRRSRDCRRSPSSSRPWPRRARCRRRRSARCRIR